MLRSRRQVGVRQAGILLAALLTLFFAASSALGQSTIPGSGFCPVGDCSGPGGTVDPVSPPQISPPESGRGGPTTPAAPGADGSAGSGNTSGRPGTNDDQGQPGRAGIGMPGRSGNPSPTPSVRVPAPAGGRTIPNNKPFGPTTSKTSQAASSTGSALLPFTVVSSPFPVLLEESPVPSPSPTPGELTTALDDLATAPAEKKSSWLPLITVVAGIALLVVFLRARKKRMTASRNHRVSNSRGFR